MPTASTSNILGNTEGFEAMTRNIYSRRVLAGECIIINKYLMRELQEQNLWNDNTLSVLKKTDGSVQTLQGLSKDMKDRYKTVWEISQRVVIDHAADRQPFVDQSQSMNLYVESLTMEKFTSMHFYGWSKKLKTGCYYMRTRAAVTPDKFTITRSEDSEDCVACSS
jgi:ribonucleotide reductase alpha subunit